MLDKIAEASNCGVDYIQLREKTLTASELEKLAGAAMQIIQTNPASASAISGTHSGRPTALLINSRTDVALAVGAAGVHLRSHDVTPPDVRTAWTIAPRSARSRQYAASDPIIGVSCHSRSEVAQAAAGAAAFAVFGPIFEKRSTPKRNDASETTPAGLDKLAEACQGNIPVLALGGVTLENAASCLLAGAAGIAGIRLFQENDVAAVVGALRH